MSTRSSRLAASALTQPIDRRRFLRNLGICMALPAMESFSSRLIGATASAPPALAATTATGAPLRTAFLYFPNGAIPSAWWPTGLGASFVLNRTREPLAGVKDHLQILGGLTDLSAEGGADGGGDHARANSTFLTGVRIKKTNLPGWLSRRLVDNDGTLTAIAIGDIVLAGVPCDWSAELGARVHQAADTAGFHSMVVGFADDYIGYCMSPDVYESGAYEAAMAFNGPNTGVQLADALEAIIRTIAVEPGKEKDAR